MTSMNENAYFWDGIDRLSIKQVGNAFRHKITEFL